jgi:hypothetical protein
MNKKELKQIIGKEIDRVHTRINSLEERNEKLEKQQKEIYHLLIWLVKENKLERPDWMYDEVQDWLNLRNKEGGG